METVRQNEKKAGADLLLSVALLGGLFHSGIALASQDNISLFPIEHYDQSPTTWINPEAPNYNKPLLSPDQQQKRMADFYDHFTGKYSPWSETWVNHLLNQRPPDDVATLENSLITSFSNRGKSESETGYGENFRPHTDKWIDDIADNMNVRQFAGISFHENRRAIAIQNLDARVLPTTDVHFYSYRLAGQGYPFDNLQMSSLWAGTPVYSLGTTRDHAWSLVITPDYIAWVKTSGIAFTDSYFVNHWTIAAKQQLAAITRSPASLVDTHGKFLLQAYMGSVFPAQKSPDGLKLMIPVSDEQGHAIIRYATVQPDQAVLMPLAATPHHFSELISALIDRPYGWGNLYFYNDCSAELKSLMTPFGIWLPRHSADQPDAGLVTDMSHGTPEERIAGLIQHGKPLMSIVYIGGHIFLYTGYHAGKDGTTVPMTYQDIWGLSPATGDRRAVIGKSVFLPLLMQFPEDSSLVSLAAKKYFKLSDLGELPADNGKSTEEWINLRPLMGPESLFSNG